MQTGIKMVNENTLIDERMIGHYAYLGTGE